MGKNQTPFLLTCSVPESRVCQGWGQAQCLGLPVTPHCRCLNKHFCVQSEPEA